jgi:hypothetical protein
LIPQATPYSIGEQSPLEYWLEPTQRKTYPELSLMAITIFSIPAMSAEVERVFSGSRRTISWDRTRLSVKRLEMLECLKHWITSGLSYEAFLTADAVQSAIESIEQELADPEAQP